jgi:hypothetical protein
MIKSEAYQFIYTRKQVPQRTYNVTINVARLDSGLFAN